MVCCRFEPRGRFVFCGLESSTIQRVQPGRRQEGRLPGGHDSWVFALAFSPDGETTYSGGGDGRVVVWETEAAAPKPIRTIDAHRGWVRGHGRQPRRQAARQRRQRPGGPALGDRERPARPRADRAPRITSTRWNSIPTARRLLSGDLLGSIRQWDLATGKALGSFDAKPLHTYEGGQQVDFGGVRGLAVSPDGGSIAGGGLHKATNPLGAVHEPIALVFDAKTRKLARTLLADGIPGGVIWRLRYLADGSSDGRLRRHQRRVPALLEGRRRQGLPPALAAGRLRPRAWTFTPTACGSPRRITTATSGSLAWPRGRVDRLDDPFDQTEESP